jgi:hypothetical protein
VRGLYVLDIPLDGGNAFSHKTTKFINSAIILLGILLNGRVLLIALALSFITRICRFISGTCSLVAVVLSVTPRMSSRIRSNYLSISAVFIVKPRLEYISNTFFSELVRFSLLRFGTYSFVVNLMFLDAVTRNPRPSTNITSAVRVTSLSRATMSFGIYTYSVRTGSWVARTVLPFMDATFGPKMLLAAIMSFGVTGQFRIMFELTMCLKYFSDG